MKQSRSQLVVAALLLFVSLSCTGARLALDTAGEHSTQLGIGAGLGALTMLLGPPGWLTAALAGALGALGAILSTPNALHGVPVMPYEHRGPNWMLIGAVALALVVIHQRKQVQRAWAGAKGKQPLEVLKALGRAIIGGS